MSYGWEGNRVFDVAQAIYRSRKDESWSGWLTCSGWFTHNNGHPSAARIAWDRESSPARDLRSPTVQRNQPIYGAYSVNDSLFRCIIADLLAYIEIISAPCTFHVSRQRLNGQYPRWLQYTRRPAGWRTLSGIGRRACDR